MCIGIIVSEISESGDASRINEDQIGYTSANGLCAAWIIDGATPLRDARYVVAEGYENDVVWFVRSASRALQQYALNGSTPADIIESAMIDVADQYRRAVGAIDHVPPEDRPVAALAWIRGTSKGSEVQLEAAAFADCKIIVVRPGHAPVLLLDDGGRLDARVQRQVADLQCSGAASMDAVKHALLPSLLQGRRAQNTKPSAKILGLDPTSIANLRHESISIQGSFHLLLCSDGIFRLVDVYKQMTLVEFVETALKSGPELLLKKLRSIEARDRECHAYPRVKPSDDASILVLRLQPC
ncbi:MAG TPA: hypothetical protein VFI23_19690 [Rhizomicrobium sp.]|nr:hypothetical protein [Rhizomicrobium sp.]